ncbi:MAG: ATP-binding cassette domain-containing protein [Bacteroidota bacterium]
MLFAENLRKSYSSSVGLAGVSFEARRGEILGLLGPNGAGKTTSLRIVLRILLPDAGRVLYDGLPFHPGVRNRIGYVPEERGLYRKSRVGDILRYCAALRGVPSRRAADASARWMRHFGLDGQQGRRLEEFSKGNQQKVQFIAAILHDPDLLVLDEPFSGLDPVNQELFAGAMLEFRNRGRAILYSTHQMDAAERLSDRICLIHRGRNILDGSIRDVKRSRGADTVYAEFAGDGSFLRQMPGVRRVLLHGNCAEIEPREGFPARLILDQMNRRLEIRRFEIREPSLHAIFLREVEGGPMPGGGEGGARP